MAGKSDTTIFYQEQVDICKKYFSAEQFGRLMLALFEVEDGNDPEVDDDIAIAFEFMSLQKRIDREKYRQRCETNRQNGLKGGAPKGNQNARKQPKQPNAKKNNPNDNENDNENDNKNKNDNKNGDDNTHDDFSSFGSFLNVRLTKKEHDALVSTYERTDELIDRVSVWLRSAKNDVPDHYALCVKFASNDSWPKRKEYVPPKVPEVTDPLSEEEQEEKVLQMRQTLGGMFGVKEA